jgi:hypothetical protein
MSLDLRIPIGLMFSLIGIILAAFGFATNSNTALYERSLGINANLWWGIALLIFGQILFQLGRRTFKGLEDLPSSKPAKSIRARR